MYRNAIAELTERIEALAAKRAALAIQLREVAYRGSVVSARDEEKTVMTKLSQLPDDLPVPEDDGAADHLLGQPIGSLSLPSTSGRIVALDDLGSGQTVLYIYPLTGRPDIDLPDGWDNIPGARGCTAEACDFRDHYSDLLGAGASAVFGLSSQDSKYQQEVAERLRLPFEMLSDIQLSLARELRLPTFQAGGLTLYKRLTLVIDGGTIKQVFYPVFPPSQHAQQVLAWLRSSSAHTGG
jgi:peroxiredoxin